MLQVFLVSAKASVLSKTTLHTGSVGGAGASQSACKMGTFFIRFLTLTAPILKNFQSNGASWQTLKQLISLFTTTTYSITPIFLKSKNTTFTCDMPPKSIHSINFVWDPNLIRVLLDDSLHCEKGHMLYQLLIPFAITDYI